MSSNLALIAKADLALADLVSNGGLLNPEQSDRFLRNLMDSPTLLNAARVVTMNAPQKKINKIGFGSRILRKATSATALAANDRVKPDLGQIELNTKEVIAELHLPYDVIEDNIERGSINAPAGGQAGGLMNTLLDLISERTALDLEELAVLGDTALAGTDAFLGLTDGFIKRADSHVVDALGGTISKEIFKAAVKAMPDKYLRVRRDLNFFLSMDNETEYRDTIANRVTGLGDAALVSDSALSVFGSPIKAASRMPESKAIYTNPNNLIFGVQRKINMEFDKDITKRVYIVVVTARVDFQVEEKDAMVVVNNIG